MCSCDHCSSLIFRLLYHLVAQAAFVVGAHTRVGWFVWMGREGGGGGGGEGSSMVLKTRDENGSDTDGYH
jgi:hypothetical protein